jgi:G3E family GTPase
MPCTRCRKITGMSIPVLVIGGYLGAGKTTLVNAMLERAREPIGVIVNDFGNIGIDGALIENRAGDTIELANGCVCCTLAGGVHVALEKLARRDTPPSLILIEASGVAQPAKIAQYAKAPGFTLDGIVVLVDAENVRQRARDRLIGRDVRRQIASADILIVHKIDLVNASQRDELAAWLGELAPRVPIVFAQHGDVPLDVLTASLRDGASSRDDLGSAGDHDVQHYVSWSFERSAPLRRSALEAFLTALPAATLRGKGIVQLADEPQHSFAVHLVGRRVTIRAQASREAASTSSRIVLVAAADPSYADVCDALAQQFFA